MKTITQLTGAIILCFLLCCFSPLMAQQQNASTEKEDTIIMLSGELKQGKIVEINDEIIKFTHSRETLLYTLKKSEINQIKFASGRVEIINQTAKPVERPYIEELPRMTPNLVAILPFKYSTNNESLEQIRTMGEKIQDDAFTFLSSNNGQYRFQDPKATNALLYRKGIDEYTIKGYTYEDLCKILGTEFIISGSLSRNVKDNLSASEQKNTKYDPNKTEQSKTFNVSVEKDYSNEVMVGIYDYRNERVFSKQRTALFRSADSYQNALYYMLRRSPIYNR